MNFLSMKYFLMLAEERSFTKAAERLHITQQTLSAHVAALERETGAKLFVRHVPLELTDSGAVFLRYARLFVRNELALKRELSDVSGRFEGILRIGIAPSRGDARHFPQALDEGGNRASCGEIPYGKALGKRGGFSFFGKRKEEGTAPFL